MGTNFTKLGRGEWDTYFYGPLFGQETDTDSDTDSDTDTGTSIEIHTETETEMDVDMDNFNKQNTENKSMDSYVLNKFTENCILSAGNILK